MSTIESLSLLSVSQSVFNRRSSSASFFSLLILRRISLSLGFNGFTKGGVRDGCVKNCYEEGILIWDSVLCMFVRVCLSV